MGVLFRSEKRAAHFFPEPIIPPFPGANVYGSVTAGTRPDLALQVPTVWACVGLLANAVSMLPLETYRSTSGVPARVTDPLLVTSPAAGMTQSEWLHMLMVSLLLRGNAYGRVVSRSAMGFPTQIELQNPDHVSVEVDRQTGAVKYAMGTPRVDVPNADVWHVRGMTLPGTKIGLSPISYAAAVIGLDLSGRRFAADFLDGGGIPKAVLESDQQIDQDKARTIKERILAATRSREVAVLGAGLKYTQIQVRPEESQFLLTQQANVAQIARFFHVPAGMVGGSEGGSMTYTNVEQRSLDFLTYGVSFWLKRIEDSFFGLLPKPQYVRFDMTALLRTDAETQAKVDIQYLAGKVFAPSEIRARKNVPEMTEAQKAEANMVPLTITPLGGAKALPALKQDPGAEAQVPADDQGGTPNG